MLKESKIEVNK